MEFYIFFGILIAGAIVLLWRSRRNTTSWRESPNAWLRDDTRVKPWTNDPTDDGLVTGHQPISRVSREEGHGKDGGG
jgi:hypothetical protein